MVPSRRLARRRRAAAAGGRGGGRGGPGAGADAPRDTRPRGTDLILRELKTGNELSIGNVSEFAFNKNGRHLALVIDAADQIGNGIQIRDMQSGAITPLETSTSFYERMAWAEEGDALVLLKGKDDRQYRERLFSVVGFTGFGTGAPKKTTFDPADDKSFPAGMSVSGNRQPQWTESRDALIFGIATLTKVPPRAAAGGRGAGPAAEGEAADTGRGAGAGAAADEANTERPEPRDLALQGSAPAVAAGSAGNARSPGELRDDLPAGREEAGPPGRR